jgi:hypothetical protein
MEGSGGFTVAAAAIGAASSLAVSLLRLNCHRIDGYRLKDSRAGPYPRLAVRQQAPSWNVHFDELPFGRSMRAPGERSQGMKEWF